MTDGALAALAGEIVDCRRCPRLVAWREQVARDKRASFADEQYWGREHSYGATKRNATAGSERTASPALKESAQTLAQQVLALDNESLRKDLDSLARLRELRGQ